MSKPVNFTPFKDAVEKTVNTSSDMDCMYLEGDLKIAGKDLVLGFGIGSEPKELFPVEEALD